MQSARSKAVRKYEAKNGIGSKTYKVDLELARQFKEACQTRGVSQTQALAEFMREFIRKTEASE